MSTSWGRLVCVVGNWAATPRFTAKSSISDRLHAMEAPMSVKMAISGGHACVSRKIGDCHMSVIKHLVPISHIIYSSRFPAMKNGLLHLQQLKN